MKAISLWQPHASLAVLGKKLFETRHWSTKVRGDVLVHAGANDNDLREIVQDRTTHAMYFEALPPGSIPLWGEWESVASNLPFGALIGIVTLGAPILIVTEEDSERFRIAGNGFGNFAVGRYVWPLTNPRRFVTPIRARGYQRFWNVWNFFPHEHPIA